MNTYKTALGNAEFTQSILKSKFIAYLAHAETEEEASAFVAKIRKKHSDATHNCYAYILKTGNIHRSSDDGEPSGTAGMPIYNAILGENLQDIAVVVTRYFGGTLLGTGGLVRAYGSSAKGAIDNAEVVSMEETAEYSLLFDYKFLDKINSLIEQSPDLKCFHTDYVEKITITLHIKNNKLDETEKKLKDITSDNFSMSFVKTAYLPW